VIEHSRLGGGVDGVERAGRHVGGAAGADVHDGAPPALHHAGEHGVRHPRGGLHVDPHHVPRQRLVQLVEVARVRVARAGVVHEHADVEVPDVLPERTHPRGEPVGGEVQDEGAYLSAGVPGSDVGRGGGEPVGAAADEDEPEPGPGQAGGQRAADPVRGAGDDRPRAVAAAQRPRRAEERRVQPQREARRGARGHEQPQRRERQRPRGLGMRAGHGHGDRHGLSTARERRGCAGATLLLGAGARFACDRGGWPQI
jgi:hypothetical protein